MAPPPYRRPGFSRRAQYSLFAAYVVAIAGIGVGLLLAATARFDPEGHAAVQSLVADVTLPFASAGRSVGRAAQASYAEAAAYLDAASQNRSLEAQLRQNRIALLDAAALAQENHRLRRLLRLAGLRPNAIVRAYLVASTGASARRYATLSAGGDSGVATGQPVIGSEGLIGRVVATGRWTARVLLIVDAGNVVPVRRARDGEPALATGRGDGFLVIRALEAGSNPFRKGDVFVTSGAGGIYPPGLPVALAVAADRDVVVGRPTADPARIDFATVEAPFIPQEPVLSGQPSP